MSVLSRKRSASRIHVTSRMPVGAKPAVSERSSSFGRRSTRAGSHADRRVAVAATVVVVAALVVGVSATTAAIPQFTPITASVVAAPVPVRATDGRRHLVYEVLVQNTTDAPVEMQSLAVRANGRALLAFPGAELATVMTTAHGHTNTLGPSQGATIWLDVVLRRGRPVPRALAHRLTARVSAPSGESATYTFDGARTPVRPRPARSIAPPLRRGPYLNFNGCCGLSPHRTALAAVDGTEHGLQRFAVDFIRIDDLGRAAAGDLTRNESFFTFGEPVYAVADGRVVRARNDLPDIPPLNEPPGSAFTTGTTLGNNIGVKLRGGQYALYAHLKRGSIRVHAGQRVRRGQMLARVGNSGQTGGSHLHFQLNDGPSPVASNSPPFVVRQFTLTGTVGNVEEFLTGAASADVRRLNPPSPRRGQLPLHATVVRFPG